MFVAIQYIGMDEFEKDLDELKTPEEANFNASHISEDLREELMLLATDGEESYIYKTLKYEFHFTMENNDDITLAIRYTGYTEY